ncbi:unannotated protein [freshwater metagenome]|uniref:Unannotated protein n=1 Tax=freshwater metagenome TaxID=449393 RepID=A0A6J5ZUV1_9ZZZZ
MRRIALVGDLFVGNAFKFTGAALDGALDGVDRDRTVASLLKHGAQRGIHCRIAAAFACSNFDLPNEFGEYLGALLIGCALLVLDRRPFGMSRHWCLSYW